MKTIWKFEIPVTDRPLVTMPAGARVLHVAEARPDLLWLWAEVDTDAPTEQREFVIVGTGHPLPAVSEHHGTVQTGPFVWHVFSATREIPR